MIQDATAAQHADFEEWILGREHPGIGWIESRGWLERGSIPGTYKDAYVQGCWVAYQELKPALSLTGRPVFPEGRRRQLEILEPGDYTVIVGSPGQDMRSLIQAVSSIISRYELPAPPVHYTQRSGYLRREPDILIPCSIVSRAKP